VASFDTSVVVIVDGGSGRGIVDREAAVGKVGDHVACIDGEARTHVRCTDSCFAQTQCCTVLTICFPREWTAGSEEDGATHTAEFEQGELNALSNGIPNLGAPACVAISCHTMVVAKLGGDSVLVCLCIQSVRERHVCVEWGLEFGHEGETVIDSGMDVVEHI
jgi:hypothetical protein